MRLVDAAPLRQKALQLGEEILLPLLPRLLRAALRWARVIDAGALDHERHRQAQAARQGKRFIICYFITVCPCDATLSVEFYPPAPEIQRKVQLFPPLPGLFRRFQRYGDGEVVPRPRPDLAHPVQQAQAAALGVRDAGDEHINSFFVSFSSSSFGIAT